MEDSGDLPSDPEELQAVIEEAESRIAALHDRLSEENTKMARYRVGHGWREGGTCTQLRLSVGKQSVYTCRCMLAPII